MINEEFQVLEFMMAAGQETPSKPIMPNVEIRKLRVKLIAEELLELCEAYNIDLEIIGGESKVFQGPFANESDADLISSYDAILDLLVVTIGAAVAQGLLIEPGWDEVHRSNMSKFIDGYRREDGKWMKGPSYSPANLQPIIQQQLTK